MKRLIPFTLTDAMVTASSVAEPAAGESVYNGATTYALGARVISTTTHRIYESMQAGNVGHDPTASTSAAWWLDAGPTAKWAAFDVYTSTATTAVGSYSVTLRPGFFSGLCMYGLQGNAYAVVVKDAPGGTVIATRSGTLYEPSKGLYEYLFVKRKPISKLVLSGIPMRPDAEVTITITGATGATVGAGMIAIGHLVNLLDGAEWGGVEGGATAEPITYSYIKTDEYGTTTIKRRHAATNMALRITMPRTMADSALLQIQEALDIPCAWIGIDKPGFNGLNGFGLASANVSYDSFGHAVINIKVQGMI